MLLRTDALLREVTQHRPGHVAGMPPSISDLDGKVPVLLACLVAHHLHPVELDDRAGSPSACVRIVDRRHALLDRENPRSQRKVMGLALESAGGAAAEDR